MYLLLVTSSAIVLFLKPKQDYQELIEEKNEHLADRLETSNDEIARAMSLKSEFLRNVPHEYNAPLTTILAMSDILYNDYNKLNEKQKLEIAKDLFDNSLRLDSFDSNIKMLGKLEQGHYALKQDAIDLSDLVTSRVSACKRLYEKPDNPREFVLNIEKEITINSDQDYMSKLLDNLILNAMTYSKDGKITISLSRDTSAQKISLIVEDEGIGIPKSELYDIFLQFTTSSKTRTVAGGRGVGLALCRKILELQGGKIWAESDGIKGSRFYVNI
jgi:signal transduction histidine kinase